MRFAQIHIDYRFGLLHLGSANSDVRGRQPQGMPTAGPNSLWQKDRSAFGVLCSTEDDGGATSIWPNRGRQ